MELEEQAKLQDKANDRLRSTNWDLQIQRVANKCLPLTQADIDQLLHFCYESPKVRQNTVYWGNTIIYPAISEYKLIKIGKKQ